MKLTHSCIVTKDVKKLKEFYEKILQIKGELYGEEYAEFKVGQNTLAIFDVNVHESLAPNSAKAASNKSIILEFNVDNVDEEYQRLKAKEIKWIKTPTTQPWGNRSIYFCDPDGNMISFYTSIK